MSAHVFTGTGNADDTQTCSHWSLFKPSHTTGTEVCEVRTLTHVSQRQRNTLSAADVFFFVVFFLFYYILPQMLFISKNALPSVSSVVAMAVHTSVPCCSKMYLRDPSWIEQVGLSCIWEI